MKLIKVKCVDENFTLEEVERTIKSKLGNKAKISISNNSAKDQKYIDIISYNYPALDGSVWVGENNIVYSLTTPINGMRRKWFPSISQLVSFFDSVLKK